MQYTVDSSFRFVYGRDPAAPMVLAKDRAIQRIGQYLLALALLVFGLAACTSPRVTVRWSTETELDVVGFVVYRGPTANGPWEQVSPVISARGNSVQGAEYTYTDEHPGHAQYYLIEEILANGRRHRHPPIHVVSPSPRPVWLFPMLTFALIILLLGVVLRRR